MYDVVDSTLQPISTVGVGLHWQQCTVHGTCVRTSTTTGLLYGHTFEYNNQLTL